VDGDVGVVGYDEVAVSLGELEDEPERILVGRTHRRTVEQQWSLRRVEGAHEARTA